MSGKRDERPSGADAEDGAVVRIGEGSRGPAAGPEETAPPSGPADDPEAPDAVSAGAPGMINIRNISVKCGHCDTYQTLAAFGRRGDGWNVYTYECENEVCDPAVTRTLVEVPEDLDEFARRDTAWRGGKIHAGGG